jgi:hypothetical protein
MGSRKTLAIGVTVNLEHYENLRLEVNGEVDSPEDANDLIAYLDTVLGQMGRGDPATAERIDSYRQRVLSRNAPERVPAGVAGCQDGVCPLPADILADVTRSGTGPANAPRKKPVAPNPEARPGTSSSAGEHSMHPMPGAPGNPAPPESTLKSGPSAIETVAGTTGTGSPAKPGTSPPGQARRDSSAPGSSPEPVLSPRPYPRTPAGSPSLPDDTHPPGNKTQKAPKPVAESPAGNPPPSGGLTCEECGAPITETERKMSQLFASRTLCRSCMKKTG